MHVRFFSQKLYVLLMLQNQKEPTASATSPRPRLGQCQFLYYPRAPGPIGFWFGGHKCKTEARSPAAETAAGSYPPALAPAGHRPGGQAERRVAFRGGRGVISTRRARAGNPEGGRGGTTATCVSPSSASFQRCSAPALPRFPPSPAVPWGRGGLGFRARLA